MGGNRLLVLTIKAQGHKEPEWFRMVRDGSGWFRMVPDGSEWFQMVPDGSGKFLHFFQKCEFVFFAKYIFLNMCS